MVVPALLLVPPVQARQGFGRPLLQRECGDGKSSGLQAPQQLVTAVLHRLEPMGVVYGHRQGAPAKAKGATVLRQAGTSPARPLLAEPGHGAAPALLHRFQATAQGLGCGAPGWPQHLGWLHSSTPPKPGYLHFQAHNHSPNSSTITSESPPVGSLYLGNQGLQPMTSNTPPARPETQPQAVAATVPGSYAQGRPPWLEPAVVVAVIGVVVTILGLLLSIAFGIYAMNARIDDLATRIDDLGTGMETLGADLNTRIDDLATRMDTLGANLNARIDDLATRMDTLGANLNARIDDLSTGMDTLGANLNTRIDDLNTRMDTLTADLNARMDGLSLRMDKVYQLLLPKQS